MKKIALILITACLMFSCKDDDKTIKYDGGETIDIVLLEEFNLNATSDESLSYFSDNELYVTVTEDGIIKGKNVGEANVTISNSENSVTVHVIVSLFEEPTLEFGASQERISSIYGTPKHNLGDSVYVYAGGEDWYSFAVWQMDFFFKDNHYFECDLYLRSDLDIRINQFLSENYFPYDTITDTIYNEGNEEIIALELYLNDSVAENSNVVVGKQYNAGPYDDICLFYAPFSYGKSEYDMLLSRNRKRIIE